MSLHRRRVLWQSPGGTWNLGAYDYHQVGDDHEWDVEYADDRLWWVSTGHATRDAAVAAWHQAGEPNPGSGPDVIVTYQPDTAAQTDQLEAMAAACGNDDHRRARRRAFW